MARSWRIVSNDWIPKYEDAGLDALIESLAPQGLALNEFMTSLNTNLEMPPLTEDMLIEYISSRTLAGGLSSVKAIGGTLPPTPVRPERPQGLGQDANGIWFDEPQEGLYNIVVYVNGERTYTLEEVDLSTNRSVPKAAFEAIAGDIIQLALEEPGTSTVGWFGRIVLS